MARDFMYFRQNSHRYSFGSLGVGRDVATVVVEQVWLYLAYSWG